MSTTSTWRAHLFRLLIIAALLSLNGCNVMKGQCAFWCHDSTEVQNEYVYARDECQDMAEEKVNLFTNVGHSTSAKEKSSMLLALFAKCMHSKDWGVTAPKREEKPGNVAQNPPRPGTPWSPAPYGIQAPPPAVQPTQVPPHAQLQPRPGTSWSPAPYGIQASPQQNVAPQYYGQPQPQAYPMQHQQQYYNPYGVYRAPAAGHHAYPTAQPVTPARPEFNYGTPSDKPVPLFMPKTAQETSRAGVGLAPGY